MRVRSPLFRALPLEPIGLGQETVGGQIAAMPMLPTAFPKPFVLTAIRPSENSEALLLVKSVLAAVFPAILPSINPIPMHNRIAPPSLEAATVCANVRSQSADHVPMPSSHVLRAVRPMVDTRALFEPAAELSLVLSAIADPSLNTDALLQVMEPLA